MKRLRDNIPISAYPKPNAGIVPAPGFDDVFLYTIQEENGKQSYRVIHKNKYAYAINMNFNDASDYKAQGIPDLEAQKMIKAQPIVPIESNIYKGAFNNRAHVREKQIAKIADDGYLDEDYLIQQRRYQGQPNAPKSDPAVKELQRAHAGLINQLSREIADEEQGDDSSFLNFAVKALPASAMMYGMALSTANALSEFAGDLQNFN